MKIIYSGLLLISLLYSCALFKQNTKTIEEQERLSDRQTRVKRVEEMESSNQMQRLTFRQDSLQSAYSFWLWPKGNIKFAAGNGFEGSFDSILVKGNLNQLTRQTEKADQSILGKATIKSDLTEKLKDKSVEKKKILKSFPTIIWPMIILVILIIAAFSFRKTFFNRTKTN